MTASHIELRRVEVHNLKEIDLDIPHRQLVVLCGVSGSGKTSLALDTLYAEGQRRYIESFSAYTRQFLERLEKPAAERIDGIPPSIAVTQQSPSASSRANIGTATEILDYLRLLVARIGETHCYQCQRIVRRDNPDTVVETLTTLGEKTRYMVCFPISFANQPVASDASEEDEEEVIEPATMLRELHEDGFVRAIVGDATVRLDESIDGYKITRLGHSLQSATRAHRAGESEEMVVAALLHDIGDDLAPHAHSELAAAVLRPYVSDKTYWIIKHHGLFQMYYYAHHLGGDRNARDRFKDHPYYADTVAFCKNYDQNCFDPDYENLPLEFFGPMLQRVLSEVRMDDGEQAARYGT